MDQSLAKHRHELTVNVHTAQPITKVGNANQTHKQIVDVRTRNKVMFRFASQQLVHVNCQISTMHSMDDCMKSLMVCRFSFGVRWETASWTDHKSIEEFYLRNVVVLDVFKFVSFLQLGFLLQYPRKVSVINSKVKNKVYVTRGS